VPYLVIFVTGYWTQLTLYWILGTFSNEVGVASRAGGVFRAFETAGQAVSYGLSSASHIDHVIPLYFNCALLILMIPSMVLLINKIPRIPVSSSFTDQSDVVLGNSSKGE
jgi:hypothetical protein